MIERLCLFIRRGLLPVVNFIKYERNNVPRVENLEWGEALSAPLPSRPNDCLLTRVSRDDVYSVNFFRRRSPNVSIEFYNFCRVCFAPFSSLPANLSNDLSLTC